MASSRTSPSSEELRVPGRERQALTRSALRWTGSAGWDFGAVTLLAGLLAAVAVWFVSSHGWTLYYGDALSHLNIARRIVESRTPGYDQIGTAWLPLPHLAMLPFVGRDELWRSGLAGSIPAAFAFVAAVVFLYGAIRLALDSRLAAAVGAAVFALNPNVLYLGSIPMTEAAFFACSTGLLLATVLFSRTQSLWAAALAGLVALAGTLSRYEGWFVLPFAAVYMLLVGGRRRWSGTALFCAIASLGPLCWLAHNAYYFSDPFEFFRGQYSPKAIQGMAPYPGKNDWRQAIEQYCAAVWLCAGTPLCWLGMAGIAAALWRRAFWPVVLLTLPVLVYVASLHSGGTPIFVPHLWPNSYYNTRYGTAVLPLFALACAALSLWVPVRWRGAAAAAIVLIAVSPWLVRPTPEAWITWKESEVNSVARREWTRQAAQFLKEHYRPGSGIFTTFGDITGVFLEAGLPLRDTLTWDNQPAWQAAVNRPHLFLHEEWAVAMAGGPVQSTVLRSALDGPRYTLRKRIVVRRAPVIEIYRRDSQAGIRAAPVLTPESEAKQ